MPPDPSKKAHGMETCPHFLVYMYQTDGLQLPHFYLPVSSPVYEFMSEDPGMHMGPFSGTILNFPFCLYIIYNSVYYISYSYNVLL